MKKISLLLITISFWSLALFGGLNLGLFEFQSIQAQTEESTSSASPSSSTTTKNLRERIERIVEEKREQIKGVLTEFEQKRRATMGEVQRISEETLAIKTTKATEIIPISPEITILKKNKPIAVTDIAVGDWAVVMGTLEDDTFQAKRLLISAETLRPDSPYVILGSITSIERTTMTFSPRSSTEEIKVTTTKNTIYEDINGEEIDRANIDEETQAIVVGLEAKENVKTASKIRILMTLDDET